MKTKIATAEEEFWEDFYEEERIKDANIKLPAITRVVYLLIILVGVLVFFEVTKDKGELNVNSYENNATQTLRE